MYFAPTLIFIFAVTTIVLGSPVAIRSAKSAGLRTVGFYGNWVSKEPLLIYVVYLTHNNCRIYMLATSG